MSGVNCPGGVQISMQDYKSSRAAHTQREREEERGRETAFDRLYYLLAQLS